MQALSEILLKMSGLLARPAHRGEGLALLEQLRARLRGLSAQVASDSPPRASKSAADVHASMARIEAELGGFEAQMRRLRAVDDSAERSRLLGKHARALRRSAAAVRELDGAFSPHMRAMMGGGNAASDERMMIEHDLIAWRVSLMERLMEQIVEQSMGHLDASGALPPGAFSR